MGRRKARKETPEDLIPRQIEEIGNSHEEEEEQEQEEGDGRFYACYLLTSLCPRFKGHTYIGFTVNPRRRIRQHNGEIRSGAWRTKKKRPWEMVFCIYGFPTNVAALQFEWAWQHPVESLAVRKAAATFKSLSGIANKIKLAYTMLTLPSWQSMNLTVNFFSTKYKKHTSGCPDLPGHMMVQVCSMDDLPCYTGNKWNLSESGRWDGDEECDGSGGTQESTEEEATRSSDSLGNGDSGFDEEAFDLVTRTRETTCKPGIWKDDNVNGQARDSSAGKDCCQSFCLNDSPPGSPSSSLCTLYNVEDREMFRSIKPSGVELDQPSRKQSLIQVADNKDKSLTKSPGLTDDVEVIDLFTPSPCYRVSPASKKRRLSNVCPQIIDLTESPIPV